MGLMDKVKAQATQLAQKTQETAREGKARLDQAQANRRADTLLRNLGALVYAERTGRAAADSHEQIEKLIADISAHEAENSINLAGQSTDSWSGASGQTGPPAGPTTFTEPGASSSPAGTATSFPAESTTSSADPASTSSADPASTSSADPAAETSFPPAAETSFPPAAETSFPPAADNPEP